MNPSHTPTASPRGRTTSGRARWTTTALLAGLGSLLALAALTGGYAADTGHDVHAGPIGMNNWYLAPSAPTISLSAPVVAEGTDVTVTVARAANPEDNNRPMTATVTLTPTTGGAARTVCTTQEGTGNFNCPLKAPATGSYALTATLTDKGTGSTSPPATATLTVLGEPHPPTINAFTKPSIAGDDIPVTATRNPADKGRNLKLKLWYNIGDISGFFCESSAASTDGALSCTHSSKDKNFHIGPGMYHISGQVTDTTTGQTSSGSQAVDLTVLPPAPQAPQLAAPAPAEPGTDITLTATNRDGANKNRNLALTVEYQKPDKGWDTLCTGTPSSTGFSCKRTGGLPTGTYPLRAHLTDPTTHQQSPDTTTTLTVYGAPHKPLTATVDKDTTDPGHSKGATVSITRDPADKGRELAPVAILNQSVSGVEVACGRFTEFDKWQTDDTVTCQVYGTANGGEITTLTAGLKSKNGDQSPRLENFATIHVRQSGYYTAASPTGPTPQAAPEADTTTPSTIAALAEHSTVPTVGIVHPANSTITPDNPTSITVERGTFPAGQPARVQLFERDHTAGNWQALGAPVITSDATVSVPVTITDFAADGGGQHDIAAVLSTPEANDNAAVQAALATAPADAIATVTLQPAITPIAPAPATPAEQPRTPAQQETAARPETAQQPAAAQTLATPAEPAGGQTQNTASTAAAAQTSTVWPRS